MISGIEKTSVRKGIVKRRHSRSIQWYQFRGGEEEEKKEEEL